MTTLADWLKNTVPGIIVLGAAGSVLAFFLLKALAWVGRKVAAFAFIRVMAFQVRPFVVYGLLASKYVNSGDWPRLQMLYTSVFVGFCTTLSLFTASALFTAFYLSAVGAQPRGLAIALVSVTGLLLIALLRDAFGLAGVFGFVFYRDFKEVKALLKNRMVVLAGLSHLGKALNIDLATGKKVEAAIPTDSSKEPAPPPTETGGV